MLPPAVLEEVSAAVEAVVAQMPGTLARVAIADCLWGEATGNRRGLDTARRSTLWGRLAHHDRDLLRPAINAVIVERLDSGQWASNEHHAITPTRPATAAPAATDASITPPGTNKDPALAEDRASTAAEEIPDLVTALERAVQRAQDAEQPIRSDIGPRLRRLSRLATPRSRRIRRTVPTRPAKQDDDATGT